MPTNTGRSVAITDQIEQVDLVSALQRLADRPNTSWLPAQSNESATLLSSTVFTTTQNIAPGNANNAAGGVTIFTNITVRPAAETLTLSLQGQDPSSSNWVTLATASAIGAVGTYVWQPPVTLPLTWRLVVTPSAVGSWTASFGYVYTRDRPAADAQAPLRVDPTGTTTQPVSGTVTATSVGDVAHDGMDSGNPVKQGAKAIAHGANPTAVAANDRTDIYANRHGIPFTIGGHPNIITRRDNFTSAQTDTALVTVGSGTKIVVTRMSFAADNANTVDVAVRAGFGAANTPTTTGVVASHPGLAAGGVYTVGDGSAILGVGADGEDLRFTGEVPTGGSIDVLTSFYTIES